VSFQENAWVDFHIHIHIHGICEVLGPVNELLASKDSNTKGLCIEDNLSSHKTEIVDDALQTKNSCSPPLHSQTDRV
jgi:hypothetical protein